MLSKAQIEYAAADAWAHLNLAEAGEMGSGEIVFYGSSSDSDAGSDSDSGGAEGAPASRRRATYRHQRGHHQAIDPSLLDNEFGDADTADFEEEEDGALLDEDAAPDEAPAGSQPDAAAVVAESQLKAARRQIDEYFNSNRTSCLELSSIFSCAERKLLHAYIDRYALWHGSVGVNGSRRRIVVRRWKPIVVVTVDIAASAIGSLVAKDSNGAVLRGHVTSYSVAAFTWQLQYPGGSSETVGIDELNVSAEEFEPTAFRSGVRDAQLHLS